MADEPGRPVEALPAFAGAVAHEIRTPLAAVAGEVELALCRDRTVAEYRDALRRIGDGIAELIEITGDLSLLASDIEPARAPAPLDAVLQRVRERYAGTGDVDVAAEDGAGITIADDEGRLYRAIALVLEHAVRHRRNGAPVALHVEPASRRVRLLVEAQAPGFWPRAWVTLASEADDPAAPLRLRTARRILDACGGALRAFPAANGADGVCIELPLA